MGELADMHVEAYAAGLDPNEMDGNDWAEFYEELEESGPMTTEEVRSEISADLRVFLMEALLGHVDEGETTTDALRRVFPELSEGQAAGFLAAVQVMNGFPAQDTEEVL